MAISLQNCSTKNGRSGRGPTRLISPLRILNTCGNSSKRVRRRNRPTFVIRSSLSLASTGPDSFSASATMVRNLQIRNILLFWVTLSCVYSTGPLLSSLIQRAMISINGEAARSAIAENSRSQNRLKTRCIVVRRKGLIKKDGVSSNCTM